MKKIPGIYKPNIEKKLNNNSQAYYSFEEVADKREIRNEDPIAIINRLIGNGSYIFNKKVYIRTKNKSYSTKIAGKVGNKLVTLDGDTIDIDDIISLKEN